LPFCSLFPSDPSFIIAATPYPLLMNDLSRRTFLATAGAAAATIWIAAETRDLLAAGLHAAQAKRFDVLSDADAIELEAATAQIIPTDETPGAREARVIYFIDRSLGTFAKDQRKTFEKCASELRSRAGKAQRGTRSFAALPEDKQIEVLTAMEKQKPELFGAIRFATIAGMLANPEYGGNYNKTGWKWIGFDDRFSWAAPFGWYDRNA
jgi:gluconate 2-dehydrogenase gamma chain